MPQLCFVNDVITANRSTHGFILPVPSLLTTGDTNYLFLSTEREKLSTYSSNPNTRVEFLGSGSRTSQRKFDNSRFDTWCMKSPPSEGRVGGQRLAIKGHFHYAASFRDPLRADLIYRPDAPTSWRPDATTPLQLRWGLPNRRQASRSRLVKLSKSGARIKRS